MILVNRRIILISFLLLFSCTKKVISYQIFGYTQGTTYYIKYNHTNELITKNSIDSLLKKVDLSMSTYIDNSIISLLNDNQDIFLDTLISRVIKRSIEICHQTDGMFDITVSPIVNYWGFGPKKNRNQKLHAFEVANYEIGCDKISLENNRLIKSNSTSIDVNGIAQGFTVDYLSEFLYSNGVNDFMIEVGGEIRCSNNNNGKGWKIAIDEPTDKKRSFAYVLNLTDISLATSGSYRNYYYQDSVKISHTINPKTLEPASNKLISATILYADCMSADAYATACMSFGFEDAKIFLEENNIIGSLTYIKEKDTIHYSSSDFSSFLHRSPASAPQ